MGVDVAVAHPHPYGLPGAARPFAADTEHADDDPTTRKAYSREVISFGFWFGDETFPAPGRNSCVRRPDPVSRPP